MEAVSPKDLLGFRKEPRSFTLRARSEELGSAFAACEEEIEDELLEPNLRLGEKCVVMCR